MSLLRRRWKAANRIRQVLTPMFLLFLLGAQSHAFSHFSSRARPHQISRRQARKIYLPLRGCPTEELPNNVLAPGNLLTAADAFLMRHRRVANITKDVKAHGASSETATNRRIFFAGTLMAAGVALAGGTAEAAAGAVASTITPLLSSNTISAARSSKLPYVTTPVNKRTGVTVFDAEQNGYNVRFVTYLSRFLLSFDADCQRWWYSRAGDLPRFAKAEDINRLRLQQFAAFSASVEVGLIEYRGNEGPGRLLQSLVKRYSPSLEEIASQRDKAGLSPLSEEGMRKEEREIKEARRQLALLFSLMENNQPVDEITTLLAAIDNGSIPKVEIKNAGSGYAPGYGPPQVKFPPPEAGDGYETATGRATLRPNGRLLRIDVVNRGTGYTKVPIVTISPPAVVRFGDDTKAQTAQAKVNLFKSGVNKGRIERIDLLNPGSGYGTTEIIKVRLAPPETLPNSGGVTATAAAVLEYEVASIVMITNGTGYAVEKPIQVYVEPPPLTARVNMNDPMMARIVAPDQPLPASSIPSREMLRKMPDPSDPLSVAARAAFMATNGGKGGGGGCIGRACYDTPVEAVAYPRAERDSYTAFRNRDEALRSQTVENAVDMRSAITAEGMPSQQQQQQQQRIVSASVSGEDSGPPELPSFGGPPSSSTQLLSLLPSGIGLEFNSDEGRYILAVDPTFEEGQVKSAKELSGRAFDPDFGPRGRSPIEREMELGVTTYVRFVASGAICCSAVHLALTPIDVVKTKVQTDPRRYPGVIRAFQKVLRDGGVASFFTGWAPTFVGFFVWGGVSYALTEYLRRLCTALVAGTDAAGSLEVPIILTASAAAAFVGSFIICPFEAVRIRAVAQPNYGNNIGQVLTRMVQEEGVFELFKAVPVFWAKEVPFAMGKFTVFDVSTAWMYDQFPAAREDLQLSLVVSLVGGTLGGMVAAVLSNPADATISEMKKARSDMSGMDAVQIVLERGGPAALFTGLPLRFLFYGLVVSLQFLIYDAVRFALGIGSDDLKLYLDVLGGALSESGGPI